PREIGRRTGVSAETARSRVQRGVAQLRSLLGDDAHRRGRPAAWLLLAPAGDAPSWGAAARKGVAVGTKAKVTAVAAVIAGVAALLVTVASVATESRSSAES